MIRGESPIIATFGTLGGVALGVVLGWGFMRASGHDTDSSLSVFAAPPNQA
jgi:putative ABC transport system permease protein